MRVATLPLAGVARFVDASSNTIAAVKLAPLANNDRASVTAACEHELEATPKSVASVRLRGDSSPSSRSNPRWETTAC